MFETRAGYLPTYPRGQPASYVDRAAMEQALEGTTTLFLVSARESADRVREHFSAVDAAVAAGVQRIVYVSFLGAGPDCTLTFGRDHWHTEQHIRRTGLRFIFLRNSIYQWMLPVFAGSDGVIRGPAGDGRVSALAHEDVADVAAAVLLQGDDDDGVTYEGKRANRADPCRGGRRHLRGQRSAGDIPPGDDRGGVRIARAVRCTRIRDRRLGHVVCCDRDR